MESLPQYHLRSSWESLPHRYRAGMPDWIILIRISCDRGPTWPWKNLAYAYKPARAWL